MTDARTLLHEALALTGLSATQLAEDLVRRNPRTIRRWQDGSLAVDETSAQLLRLVAASIRRDGGDPTWTLEALGVEPRPPGWLAGVAARQS